MRQLVDERFFLITIVTICHGQIADHEKDLVGDRMQSRMLFSNEIQWKDVQHTARLKIYKRWLSTIYDSWTCTGAFVAPLLMLSAHWCFRGWPETGLFYWWSAEAEVSSIGDIDPDYAPKFVYKINQVLYRSDDYGLVLLDLSPPQPDERYKEPDPNDMASHFELPMQEDYDDFVDYGCKLTFTGSGIRKWEEVPNIFFTTKIRIISKCPIPDFKQDEHVCSLNTKFTQSSEYDWAQSKAHQLIVLFFSADMGSPIYFNTERGGEKVSVIMGILLWAHDHDLTKDPKDLETPKYQVFGTITPPLLEIMQNLCKTKYKCSHRNMNGTW